MVDDSKNNGQPETKPVEQQAGNDNVSVTGASEPTPLPASSPPEDRSALIQRARVFLRSPNIVHEDPATKRQFLIDKGLSQDEIDRLMRELPPQLPAIPPRTYPQPPPSNLPRLLFGLTKILSWLTGTSAVLIFIYYRFLLPRITYSALARRSLKQHQVSLLKRLNASLKELKASHAETRAVLPQPRVSYEPVELAEIHSLDKLGVGREDNVVVPEFTLLRCAMEGLAAEGTKPTKEELFALLENRYMWLKTEEGFAYENALWETLTNNPCFTELKENDKLVWTYTPPPPPEPTPLLTSLETLKSSFPPPRSQPSPFQRTLDALTDFTGYITTQTYQLAIGSGVRTHGYSSFGSSVQSSPQQEEVKKEIRALKGLVLNRRTFAPTPVRPASYPSTAPTA